MSGIFDDTNRQAIPRCLDYSTACSLGLLRIIKKQEQAQETEVLSSRTRQEWQNSPSLATAVDLVAEALIVKKFESGEAIKAAHYILREAPVSSRLIRELANHFLEQPSLGKIEISPITQIHFGREYVAPLRKSVRTHPINPIAWSDLALSYATLGQVEKARLAMEVALSLGRSNRFILRSAARCFMHMGEPDRAVTILNRSGLCPFDPWIVSAEIAISESVGLKSKSIRNAKSLIKDDNLSHFSRSELAVGMGTMEMKNGSASRAKMLMRQALRDPTENALAQVEWMATRLRTDMTDFAQLRDKVPASYEAQARYLYYNKQFAESLKVSELWGRYQSLSSLPIIFYSYVASVCLDDHAESIRIIESAMPANRNDPLITNNYACSLARCGEVAAAEQALRKVNLSVLSDRLKLTFCATQGLILFRTGDVEKGRKLYYMAVRGFEQINELRSAAIATYFWAIEEKRIGSPQATSLVKDAKSRVERFNVFELDELAKKL